jgi:hypothetical protein
VRSISTQCLGTHSARHLDDIDLHYRSRTLPPSDSRFWCLLRARHFGVPHSNAAHPGRIGSVRAPRVGDYDGFAVIGIGSEGLRTLTGPSGFDEPL